MCVQRFDDFDRMVANDDGEYVLFEDYDLLDKQCAAQRATMVQQNRTILDLRAQLHAIIKTLIDREEAIQQLETDVDMMAWKTSPAMAQATIDQLVKRNEQLEALVKAYEDRLFRSRAMDTPPCFCCGYNGHGYYQPGTHPCAARHHAELDSAPDSA